MSFHVPDQSGRTFVVTGANSGLGRETASMLAGAGAHVVLAVRNADKGAQAAARMPGSTEVRELDLSDLASVRTFADGWDRPLAGLLNNAGIMMIAEGRTTDGFEHQLGTNHLGHFALTNLLLPQITDRVVSVSSALHRGPALDFDNLDLEGCYDPTRAYQQSKLANLLFTAELQRRLGRAGSDVRATVAQLRGQPAVAPRQPDDDPADDGVEQARCDQRRGGRATDGLRRDVRRHRRHLRRADEAGRHARRAGSGRALGRGSRRRCRPPAVGGLRAPDRGQLAAVSRSDVGELVDG